MLYIKDKALQALIQCASTRKTTCTKHTTLGGGALVLNASGVPIANILVENREIGDALFTASIALRPNETKGYLLSGGARGANIMEFESLATSALRYFGV